MNYKSSNGDYEKQVEHSIREENDNLIGKISSNMKQFKNMNYSLNDKINSTNSTVDNLQDKFNKSKKGISYEITHLSSVISNKQGSICWFIVFIFIGVFFLRRYLNKDEVVVIN